MSTCTVCCDKYNKTYRKKVTCPHCEYDACKTCIQTYLLSTTEEPHCMKCKHEHDREFIDSFCTKRVRNVEYRKHREQILYEREMVRMPETQPYAEYKIKIYDFYQYHQDAYYIAPENNDILTYTRYNLGEIKIAKDGTGYMKSNVMPNDLTWPVRPWGSSEDYNFIFDFTMTDYSLNNDTIIFDLYIVPCSGDTIFFTSTFKITPIKDGIINLEQNYEGSYWNRSIVYELEIIN